MGRYRNTSISVGTQGNPQTSFEQDTYKQKVGFINIQLFAINKQKQARHNENNTTGRSILYGGEKAAQEIIDKYQGTGTKLPGGKERVVTDRIIGVYVSKDKSIKRESNVAIIVKSKTGDHVFPGNPNKGGDF